MLQIHVRSAQEHCAFQIGPGAYLDSNILQNYQWSWTISQCQNDKKAFYADYPTHGRVVCQNYFCL